MQVRLKYIHKEPVRVRLESGAEKVEVKKGDVFEVNKARAGNLLRMYGDRFKEVSMQYEKSKKGKKKDACECGAKPGETCKEDCSVGNDEVKTQDVKSKDVKKA